MIFQEPAVKTNLNSHSVEGLGQRRVVMAGKRADRPVVKNVGFLLCCSGCNRC